MMFTFFNKRRLIKIGLWTASLILAGLLGALFANLLTAPTTWYLDTFTGHWKYTALIFAFALLYTLITRNWLASLAVIEVAVLIQCPWETILLVVSLTLNFYFLADWYAERRRINCGTI
jgi:hypothetical protein